VSMILSLYRVELFTIAHDVGHPASMAVVALSDIWAIVDLVMYL
jgi:hypothetical protein